MASYPRSTPLPRTFPVARPACTRTLAPVILSPSCAWIASASTARTCSSCDGPVLFFLRSRSYVFASGRLPLLDRTQPQHRAARCPHPAGRAVPGLRLFHFFVLPSQPGASDLARRGPRVRPEARSRDCVAVPCVQRDCTKRSLDPGAAPAPGPFGTGEGVFRHANGVGSAKMIFRGSITRPARSPWTLRRRGHPRTAHHPVPAGGQPWPVRSLTCRVAWPAPESHRGKVSAMSLPRHAFPLHQASPGAIA